MPDSAAQKAGFRRRRDPGSERHADSGEQPVAHGDLHDESGADRELKGLPQWQTVNLTAHLGEMQDKKVEKASNDAPDSDKTLQGVAVDTFSAQTARQLGLPASTKGVVVTDVDPASQAASSGLKEGDVIQEVNRQAVTNTQDFNRAVKKSDGESLLLVNRGGNKVFLAV